MTLHTYTLYVPINLLHLTVSTKYPSQDIKGHGHNRKIKGQIKVTPWHCTPTPPANVPTNINFLHLNKTNKIL